MCVSFNIHYITWTGHQGKFNVKQIIQSPSILWLTLKMKMFYVVNKPVALNHSYGSTGTGEMFWYCTCALTVEQNKRVSSTRWCLSESLCWRHLHLSPWSRARLRVALCPTVSLCLIVSHCVSRSLSLCPLSLSLLISQLNASVHVSDLDCGENIIRAKTTRQNKKPI